MKFVSQCILLVFALATHAQSAGFEKELAETGRQILAHPEYKQRSKHNQQFLQQLESYISTEEGFDDGLKLVSNMIRLEAGKDARVYTWQMPDSNYRYVRFGLVAARTRKGIVVTRLIDATKNLRQAEFKVLKAEQWYGAIYYKLIPVKKGKKEVYTLLGFAPGQEINQKVVDVIEIDGRGRPKFGSKIFRIDQFMDKTLRKPPMRLILSYGGEYAASVRWNEDKEMVIMDHLSPPDTKLKGVYRMYGPDMSYDGLYWKKGWWHLEPQVKFNSGQNIKIIPPDKPTDLPKRNTGGNVNNSNDGG